jgi:hypothetical protein
MGLHFGFTVEESKIESLSLVGLRVNLAKMVLLVGLPSLHMGHYSHLANPEVPVCM